MAKIPPFDVEQWMDKYETIPGVLNVAETCCSSISVQDLTRFNTRQNAPAPLDLSTRLTYGAIRGSDELRRNIAALYEHGSSSLPFSPDSVIVTQGAISANHLVFYSQIGAGDHVICVFPTYQQLYSIPKTLGAEVTLWELKEENGWVPNVDALEGLVKANTKMIVINNPNNPTGAIIPTSILAQIVGVAQKHDIILFSDEVYRPLFHSISAGHAPPSVVSMDYKKTIVTSSMSKAWALAGIRVGWVASPDEGIIKDITVARDYTTISVSRIDDQIANYALSPEVRPGLIARNLELAKTNLELLDQFVKDHASVVSWVRPVAGTTAFMKFKIGDKLAEDEEFCKHLLDTTKVMLLPGSKCFGHGETFKVFVRIGYVSETAILKAGLRQLSRYVKKYSLK
ncbi:hypothetical protein PG999_009973 [Apiospora kogelbergensis]|uniref:Aminotransferase class I/classII large domain-containing protein n=1 Tax=Apiospora kogelbergensis TaxID=1337665 RepID=A0AAW0QM25_9PEZI